jgi:hypothetical protein
VTIRRWLFIPALSLVRRELDAEALEGFAFGEGDVGGGS